MKWEPFYKYENRKYILFCSQVLGIIICLFYIYKAQTYEVSWSLLTWLMLTVTSKLNNFLSMTGTYILIIPLTIIIISILIPENIPLRIAGSFFGVASTSFFILSGLFHDSLTQTYNMRIVVINKILSLEEKRDIFRAEFIRMMELQYNKSLELYKILKEHIIEKLNIYDEKLITIPDALTIKIYAKETVNNLIVIYTKQENTQAITEQNHMLKYATYAVITMVVVLLGLVVFRLIFENSELKKAAELQLDGAKLSEQAVLLAQTNITNQQQLLAATTQVAEQAALTTADMLSKAAVEAFRRTENQLQALSNRQHTLTEILNNVLQRI